MARVRTGFFQKRGTPIRKGGNPQYPFQNATDLNILCQIETIYFSKFWSKKRKSSKKKGRFSSLEWTVSKTVNSVHRDFHLSFANV